MTDCGEVMLQVAEGLRGVYGPKAQAQANGAARDAAWLLKHQRAIAYAHGDGRLAIEFAEAYVAEAKASERRKAFHVIKGGKQ